MTEYHENGFEHQADCQLYAFGLKDEFIDVFGFQSDLWQAYGLSAENIYKRIPES